MSESKKQTSQTYFSNGQALTTPPLGVRLSRAFDSVVQFGALYLTTLFSTDSYAAAAASPFGNGYREANRTGNRSGTTGGAGGSGGSGGPARGQRLGTLNDIRPSGGGSMPAPVRVCAGGDCG